jgi:DNA invertase Pin-like site-specific DNA recombinase
VIYRLFHALSECERKQLVRRTQAGSLKAKAHGNKGGWPAKLSAEKLERASKLLENGETHRNVADLLGVHRTTLTRNLATYSPIGHKQSENPKNGKGLWSLFSRSQREAT